ncbi:MAG TPA: hypothetical protein VJ953_16210 [Saprospiraceae bacterium]|nr:hypothetical protein [Saprospiraceae bacterium]
MSKQSLDQLIASLKSEAIEAAEKEAQAVRASAKKEAQQILKEAKAERQEMLSRAEKEAKDIQQKGQSALQQAARDLSIGVKNDLLDLLGAVLNREVKKSFKPDLIKDAIVQVVKNVGGEVELKMSESFTTELADYIHQQLNNVDGAVTISQQQHQLNQLTIQKTDQGWSYEVSPEEVGQLLRQQLTGKWTELLKKEEK